MPYLPLRLPYERSFLSACLVVPRDAPLRWDESYGARTRSSAPNALAAGLRLVFRPRFSAAHEHDRRTYGDLRRQQRRPAYGLPRGADRRKRTLRRVPLRYFALLQVPVVYRRIAGDPRLRGRFLAVLPRLVIAEWTRGASARHYVARRPALRSGPQPLFE